MRTFLILGLTVGLLLAGCGSPKSIADSFSDPEIKRCATDLENAEISHNLSEDISSINVGIAKTNCRDVFYNDEKFKQLTTAILQQKLKNMKGSIIQDSFVAGFQKGAAFDQKLMGSITTKTGIKGFAVFADEKLLWNIEIFDFDASIRPTGTEIIGLWCNPFVASDSATDNIIQISKDGNGKFFLTEHFNDTTPTNDTTLVTPMEFDGRIFSVDDVFSTEYNINENGTLDVMKGGKTLRVAKPVTELVRPFKCVR